MVSNLLLSLVLSLGAVVVMGVPVEMMTLTTQLPEDVEPEETVGTNVINLALDDAIDDDYNDIPDGNLPFNLDMEDTTNPLVLPVNEDNMIEKIMEEEKIIEMIMKGEMIIEKIMEEEKADSKLDVLFFEEPVPPVEEIEDMMSVIDFQVDSIPSELEQASLAPKVKVQNETQEVEDKSEEEVGEKSEEEKVEEKTENEIMEKKEESARRLVDPDPEKCVQRPRHFSHRGHGYFYSGDEEEFSGKVDWLEGRNICRKFCMDLVSIETPKENEVIKEFLTSRDLPYIWTSGRLCNFKGCDRPDLQPASVAGWFWSGSGVRMAPTNSTPPFWPSQPWSHTGHRSQFEDQDVPQPDNAEFLINGSTEACMAVFNDVYDDGVSWHDVACYHRKFFICEDSNQLLRQSNI